jgi:putative PIN family toxin of toxin-antitoxin system
MIVVLDTNVVVSGILRPLGPAGSILRLTAAGIIRLAHDTRILSEYKEVLGRAVFGFSENLVHDLIDQFEQEGLAVVGSPLPFRLPDPDDEPFLEVALAAQAHALVTGNKRHFPRRGHRMKVLSPAEFISDFSSEMS